MPAAELSQGELEAVVRKGQIAASWMADTYYPQGATVIPSTSNGHLYTCTFAGTSGATEPAFNQMAGTTTTDGTVTWTESGLESGFYDTDLATFEAWLKKTGKASVLIQTSSAGQSPRCSSYSRTVSEWRVTGSRFMQHNGP